GPARGVNVAVRTAGVRVSHRGGGAVSLDLAGTASAETKAYANGVSRTTAFGNETVTVTPQRTEQFLTVDRRQGPRTWAWTLRASHLMPAVEPDGSVRFTDRRGDMADLHVLPVAILDRSGNDVTPAGLRWTVKRRGQSWRLLLRLDDANLPVPYVIDPAV